MHIRKYPVKDRRHPRSSLIYEDSFWPCAARTTSLGLECLYTMKGSIDLCVRIFLLNLTADTVLSPPPPANCLHCIGGLYTHHVYTGRGTLYFSTTRCRHWPNSGGSPVLSGEVWAAPSILGRPGSARLGSTRRGSAWHVSPYFLHTELTECCLRAAWLLAVSRRPRCGVNQQ